MRFARPDCLPEKKGRLHEDRLKIAQPQGGELADQGGPQVLQPPFFLERDPDHVESGRWQLSLTRGIS